MSRTKDYTTRNLLDFSNDQNYYKLISIDLSTESQYVYHKTLDPFKPSYI